MNLVVFLVIYGAIGFTYDVFDYIKSKKAEKIVREK